MKQITIVLNDAESLKFITNLLDLNITFTVTTTVAKDPMVFAAAEALPPPAEPVQARVGTPYTSPNPSYKVGMAKYNDSRGRTVQRHTPEGHTSYEVVEAKVRSFRGRKFHMDEVKALAPHSGFQAGTLQNQLSIMVARGLLVKVNKWEFRVPPALVKAAAKEAQGPQLPGLDEHIQAPSLEAAPLQ